MNRYDFCLRTRCAKSDWSLGCRKTLCGGSHSPARALAVRILGPITREKIRLLQDADAIYREEIARAGLDREISQYFAVLPGVQSVGVMGDGRTYDNLVALRAVKTSDFMTVDWYRIPFDVLERISSRIVNEVRGVNRVVYDITNKPPATIEWE